MKGQAALLNAAGIGVTLACLFSAGWLGPFGAMLNLLTPVAAAYLGMRFGLQSSVIVVSVVALLVWQLAPLGLLAAYLGLFGAGSLLLPLLLRRNLDWDRAVLLSSCGAALVILLLAAAALGFGGMKPEALIGNLLQAEIDQAMQIYRESGFTESQLDELRQVVEQIAAFIRQAFFGLVGAALIAVQLFSLQFLHWLKREDYRIPGPPFDKWRLPPLLIWVLIAAGFCMVAPLPTLSVIGRNLLAVLLPLYFLQGLAVVSNFLQRKPWPPLFKGMIYLMVFIFSPLPLIITGVGVFDLWIDFRRPRKKDI